MSKKNITVEDGERLGEYQVVKKRGKLTLQEILDTLRENDADLFFLIFDAREDTYQGYGGYDEIDKGDCIQAYKDFAIKRFLGVAENI